MSDTKYSISQEFSRNEEILWTYSYLARSLKLPPIAIRQPPGLQPLIIQMIIRQYSSVKHFLLLFLLFLCDGSR
ncbi:hypothetical protein, partial [Nostoc sp. S13]|uniref:hypothetical protein n=1 Tax=Nostoc sp. S13 TaxID=3019266 RepID=UPI00261C2004